MTLSLGCKGWNSEILSRSSCVVISFGTGMCKKSADFEVRVDFPMCFRRIAAVVVLASLLQLVASQYADLEVVLTR